MAGHGFAQTVTMHNLFVIRTPLLPFHLAADKQHALLAGLVHLDDLHTRILQATIGFRAITPCSCMASCRKEPLLEYVVSVRAVSRNAKQHMAKLVEPIDYRMVLWRTRRWNCLPSHGDGA